MNARTYKTTLKNAVRTLIPSAPSAEQHRRQTVKNCGCSAKQMLEARFQDIHVLGIVTVIELLALRLRLVLARQLHLGWEARELLQRIRLALGLAVDSRGRRDGDVHQVRNLHRGLLESEACADFADFVLHAHGWVLLLRLRDGPNHPRLNWQGREDRGHGGGGDYVEVVCIGRDRHAPQRHGQRRLEVSVTLVDRDHLARQRQMDGLSEVGIQLDLRRERACLERASQDRKANSQPAPEPTETWP